MHNTPVKELMAYKPILVGADDTLQEAACKMRDADCGILPVGTETSLQGIITDRDIVIRAICEGKDPATEKVRDYMTAHVYACKESDTLKDAAELMRSHDVSRLVVKDDSGNLSGILSFGRILRKSGDTKEISDVVSRATGKQAA